MNETALKFKKYNFDVGFLLLTLVPTAIFMIFGASSFCAGITLAIILWTVLIFINYKITKKMITIKQANIYFILLIISIFTLILNLIKSQNYSINKAFITQILLYFECLCLIIISNTFNLESVERIQTSSTRIIIIFGFIAIGTAIGIAPLGNGEYVKPMIIFTEYSHFILFLAPFYIFCTLTYTNYKKVLIFFSLLFFVLFFQSLTGVFLLILSLTLIVNIRYLFLIVSAALIILFTIQDNYFFSRINFINGEANLSSMIWISGWERAWLELKNSYGLGVGFQQLGYSDIKGAYMDNIIRLFGKPFNLYDGGSLAPKIIAEFGLLGIIVIFSYLILFFHLVYKMRNIAKLNRGLKSDEIFFCFYSSLIVSFSLELFVRGVGYFSSGVTFFTLGFMLYLKKVII